jgi:hypothetical protein
LHAFLCSIALKFYTDNFCNCSAADFCLVAAHCGAVKFFWCSNFFQKMLPRSRASSPCRCPQAAKLSAPRLSAHGEQGEKSDRISRGGEQDRLPFVTALIKLNLENVPVEHFQRVNTITLIPDFFTKLLHFQAIYVIIKAI